MDFIFLMRTSSKMRILAYILILLLTASNAFAQGSRQIQSSDVTGALGYTPLRSIGAMTGPAILCGTGISCSLNTISATLAAGGSSGQIQYNNAGALGGFTLSGDATADTSTGALTLATVNANVGSFGSATQCATFTTNGKGLITAASQTACSPGIASITGLGTGVSTALAISVGSAGALVTNGGALGTPSSGVATNLTGTASGLTAGAVSVSGITGAGAGCITFLTTPSSANFRGCLTDETGTGLAYFQGGALGTPSSATLTNATGLPLAGISAMAADTVAANATGGSASPTAVAIGSCSTASSALTYNTTTHAFGCNTISGAGTVTTTGTPANGNLTKFSGSTSITNGDLSGDITTSGTLATTYNNVVPTAKGGVPQGAWSTYTPSPTCSGGTITTNSARFQQIAPKSVLWQIELTVATGPCNTTSSQMTFTLPSTAQSAGSAAGWENAGGVSVFCSVLASSATMSCRSSANLAATSHVLLSGIYENQ